jgi:type I restriction enzyme R subunit
MKPDEAAFEEQIGTWLVDHGGYQALKVGNRQGEPTDFDPTRGIDTAELFTFIGATQADEWDRLVKLHGGTGAQSKFVERLAKELDSRGTVDVLRHGVVDLGVTIRLAYFRPAHGLTPVLQERYEANRLTVTRQLPYQHGSTKTLDLCLFVNGVPVATAELKNKLTHQSVEHAMEQYRTDRDDPSNVTLNRRAVVHFAIDPHRVAMTTRLAGADTRFLPFNRGDGMGAGNPAVEGKQRTSYLWEQVWQRDAWLDLLARFIHVEQPAKGSKAPGAVIFPRFHQWDAVLKMEADARAAGPGEDYLVQHSAGSGKSNTIAWLAHRLSSLHNTADAKVFDKVIVITDRVVLDRQLQETIYQFEHAHGVVVRIDESSAQLADALVGEQARIIITTLQKFPFVMRHVEDLPNRSYAVIVDEAHSSQTGESAKELKKVLGAAGQQERLVAAELDELESDREQANPTEDLLAAEVLARGRQPNLSFFAFTATPKGKTLELFGRRNPATDRYEAFHVYSMRQAIQEGFILDVLANYVTYETYWKIEKAIADDPEFESKKAQAAIARFVSLHEHNLAQKAEIIVEHFRQHVAHRVKGKAKAMTVTSSRLHAVRYKQALDAYIAEHGYDDIRVLVAFSGTVDDEGVDRTESNMNGIPDTQTAAEFKADPSNRILVVAEKYQTGFDEPLLCAMYVDKVLTGLNAVQTLSRLNRSHRDKRPEDVVVLDFRNDTETILSAFEPYYGETVAPPTDPNLLYDTRTQLGPFDVLRPEEMEAFVDALLAPGGLDHGRVHSFLEPAVDRFWALDEEDDQPAFRDALGRFVRTYSFLSQLVSFGDTKLERDYLYCRALTQLIREAPGTSLDLGDAVELSHLRIQQQSEGSIGLTTETGEVKTLFGEGTGGRQPDDEPLSVIIGKLNDKYGTDWTEADILFFDAIAADLTADASLQLAASANTEANFGIVFANAFERAIVSRLDRNQDMGFALLDNDQLRGDVLAAYLPLVYGKAKVARQEHCPIGELLGPDLESAHLEYKATLRTRDTDGELHKPLETSSLKTVAAFLNAVDGGTLLVGVADDGTVHGIESDYATLHKDGKDDRDLFQLHLGQIITDSMGAAAATHVTTQIHTIDGKDIARVHVTPSGLPVDAVVTVVDKQGQHLKKTGFYVRVGNGTKELDEAERAKYTAGRW